MTTAGRRPLISRSSLKAIKPLYAVYRRSIPVRIWLRFQARLLAASVADLLRRRGRDDRPLPPARLRYRVSGSLDPVAFQQTGRTIAADLRRILASLGMEIGSFERVLDFGCGCGRVMGELVGERASSQLHGTDIDPDLVGWCQRHIPNVQWAVNAHEPPLEYADASFDLVYGVSVFTHLDERMQDLWLGELHRVAKPGGLLILTVLGNASISKLGEAKRSTVLPAGFGYFTGTTGRLKLDGLPDFYQIAYHTPEYVAGHWSRWFDVIGHLERAINDHQDAIVLRKPERSATAAPR